MKELISVIMSVYNEEPEWVKLAIDSILNQTYEYFEYIIILDNPNNTNLDTLLSKYSEKDSRILYSVNEKNIGLTKSLNRALNYAKGAYIARMDADDISFKDRFEKQLKTIKKQNADLVFGYMDFIDEYGTISSGEHGRSWNSKQIKKITAYGNISTHPTWFAKKEVYDTLKGYRDISFCEDYDFLIRAIQKNYNIFKAADKVLYYRIRNNSISKSNALIQYQKTKYLREQFKSGKNIVDISEYHINKMNFNWSKKEKLEYASTKNLMERFCRDLYCHHYMQCTKNVLTNWQSSKWYREVFYNNVKCRFIMFLAKNFPVC